ncbi:MAG: DUF2459 domain-containing protein [Hyphomonadaceae bacterium]|nr:DUF2459 domain-containing protein [Hyphomonadaceae bacterium]
MKRRFAILAAVAAALAFWSWTGTRPALGAPPATKGDCVDVGLWSNGWHTSYSLPAELLPADHPLRRLYPQAHWFLVGWGDSSFYRSDGTDLLLGLKALLPGGATVMHVIASKQPAEETFIPAELVTVGVSRAGAQVLAERLKTSLDLDAGGNVRVVAPGQHGPQSRFLAARGAFDLFQVCNHWTARGLRSAGVDINAAFVYRGEWLTAQTRRKAPACAALSVTDKT